jgi:putative hydrolase of the HAD superfamily
MRPFSVIAFDADDTLWYNERLYVRAQTQLKALLSAYVADEQMDERLYQTEMRNLDHFGYGIKAFTLSMIETAIELTDGRISARDIQAIIENARAMMVADVDLLDHVDEVLGLLAADHALMLITKGDLLDQERKLARSGLAEHFRYVEIVSDKAPENYRAILDRIAVPASDFLMVGNSLRSDILPVLELGGTAVYVPQELTWVHESAELPPSSEPGFHRLEHLGQLPALLTRLEEQRGAAG